MGLLDFLSEKFREPAECLLTVDGEEVADLYPFLMEVTVDCSRTSGCEATLKFEIRRDEEGGWTVLDDETFIPWKPILIEAAFGSRTEEVMNGFIQQIDADYPSDQGNASLTVKCRDTSLLLDREHIRDTWGTEEEPVSDEEIVQQIVENHGLGVHGDSQPGQSNLIQKNQDATDVTFLRARADANGYELLFEGEEVYFGPMRVDEDPQEAILVYAGKDTSCMNFSVNFDGHMPDQVAYDVADEEGDGVTEEMVESDLDAMGATAADSTSAGLNDFVWRLSREGTQNAAELAALALLKANEFAMKLKAQGELDSTMYGHVLRVGHPVTVDGTGTSLGGTYYVDNVSHRFTADGYTQSFKLLRNAYGEQA